MPRRDWESLRNQVPCPLTPSFETHVRQLTIVLSLKTSKLDLLGTDALYTQELAADITLKSGNHPAGPSRGLPEHFLPLSRCVFHCLDVVFHLVAY